MDTPHEKPRRKVINMQQPSSRAAIQRTYRRKHVTISREDMKIIDALLNYIENGEAERVVQLTATQMRIKIKQKIEGDTAEENEEENDEEST
jgi:hypothetical protein